MDTESKNKSERDRRLDEVVTAYFKANESCDAPSQAEWLARYPDLAEELTAFFAAQAQVDALAAPLRLPAATEAATVAPPSAPAAPTKLRYFGDYELLEEIARGGMGVVYKARQVTLKRVVAVKMILAGELAHAVDVERFYTEARAAANLHHPNIVAIYEVNQHEQQHYFSMEYVAGESLAHRIARGPLAAREAAGLLKKVAEAVAFAHVDGVIHRDLKPANILLDSRGEPHVTDFGLAKRLQAEPSASASGDLTATGQVLGTPSYMPPEQAAGKTKEIGPSADVYSLGAVLYCALTGRPPFQAASTLDTLLQVVDQEPASPRTLDPATPRDVETICLKCLEKDPRRRYGSAQELADELQCFLDGKPILARPIGAVGRFVKWTKRRPAVAALLAAIFLVTLAGMAGIAWALGIALDQRNQARAEKKNADQQLRRADGLLYASQLALAQQAWDNSQSPLARHYLDACRLDLRGWEHHYLRTHFNRNQKTMRGHAYGVSSVAWSPDGKRIVSGSSDQSIKIWDAESQQCLRTLEGHTGEVRRIALSADGQLLVSGGLDKALRLWDPDSGTPIRTIEVQGCEIMAAVISPDRKRIYSGGILSNAIVVWDAANGKELQRFLGHTHWIMHLDLSPDGKRLVSASYDKTVKLWDTDTGKTIHSFMGHESQIMSVALCADGKRIVSGSLDHTAKVWDAVTGQEIRTLNGHAGGVLAVAVSADGKRIVTGGGSGDMTLKTWDADTGASLRTFKGHTGSVSALAFSPDGARILSGSQDGTLKMWNTAADQQPPAFSGHIDGGVIGLTLSPDGEKVVSAGWDQTVRIWDANAGTEIRVLRGHTSHVTGAAFSPDGKLIASGSGDRAVKIWDADSGNELRTLNGHTAIVTRGIAFSPDGKLILSGSSDKTIKLWDASTGAEVRTFTGHTDRVHCVAFSPDGKRIVSGGNDRTIKIWDTAAGAEIRTLHGHVDDIGGVTFDAEGARVASASADKTAKVWDAATGAEIMTLTGHTASVSSVAFSPDGKRIVSGGDDKLIKVWNAVTGQETLTIKGHTADVTCLAFSHDGKRLFSGSADRTIKIWDAALDQQAPR